MSKEGYVPLSEVYSESIRSGLNLPFGLSDEIGLNVKKAEWLAQVGGLRTVVIKNDPNGETSKVQHNIVGINKDGSGMAGASKVDYAPTSGLEMKQDKYRIHSARWADVTIKINTEEVTNRILGKSLTATDPNSWVPDLNRAISTEVRKAGNKQLLPISPDYFGFFWVYSWNAFYAISSAIEAERFSVPLVLLSIAGKNIVSGIVWETISTIFSGAESRGKGSRLTLGIGPELDRAAVFNLSFLGKPLVASLENKPKIHPMKLKKGVK